MEAAEVGLCSSKTPPCTPGPAGSQLCGDVQTETCEASGGASVEHVTPVDLQKNVKKEETEDEDDLCSMEHITPVDQQNQIKTEEFEEEEEKFCGGTSNAVENIDDQNRGFEIKHVKVEESEDEDYI
ncbi:zinc finger protein 32-like, partial [Clarias magur]